MANQTGRNAPCHCGSGEKYKHCCQGKDKSSAKSKWMSVLIGLVILFGLLIAWFSFTGDSSPGTNCPPGTTWSEAHQHCH